MAKEKNVRGWKPQQKGNGTYNAHITNNDIIKKIIGGWERGEILDYLVEKGKNRGHAEALYSSAAAIIHDRAEQDLDKNLQVHIYLYEKIFKFFDQTKYTKGKLRALDQKEKLLGFHRSGTEVEINNTVNVNYTSSIYDLKKLNTRENDRLSILLSKVGKKSVKSLNQQVEQKYLK